MINNNSFCQFIEYQVRLVAVTLEVNSQFPHLLPGRLMGPHMLLNSWGSPRPAVLGSSPMKEVLFMGQSSKNCIQFVFRKILVELVPFYAPSFNSD